jgi:AcrR family transcriptional regulator
MHLNGILGCVSETLGLRETKKLATRQALQEASERLFAERGFVATTVREIADAAGVTERTFFRYFNGKEELVVDHVLAWLPVLQDRIRARPVEEGPLTALKEALLRVDKRIAAASRPGPLWLFSDGPPIGYIARSGPQVLLRTEAALSEVFRERLVAKAEAARAAGHRRRKAGAVDLEHADVDFLADTYAKTALALIRSVLVKDGQLRASKQRGQLPLSALADIAFTAIQEG